MSDVDAEVAVDGYRVERLSAATWEAYADLAARHNGVWGGCWCTWFHSSADADEQRSELGNREFKRRLVEQGRTHAAVVFDGEVAIAWAQYGTVEELPNIHHRKQWEREPSARRTTGSPASSSTAGSGAGAWPRSPCAARSR